MACFWVAVGLLQEPAAMIRRAAVKARKMRGGFCIFVINQALSRGIFGKTIVDS
jgi:hypothetical protein